MPKRLPRPKFLADIEPFGDPVGDFGLVDVKCLEFMRHEPLGNTHIHPPAGQMIDQRIIFRDLQRIA